MAAGGVLDAADAPVLQVVLAASSREQWAGSTRGLGAADLAMHVVLPEIDGRIVTRAISFKQEARRSARLEFTRIAHAPLDDRVAYVADLACAWANLRRKPRAARRLACVLSDYPAKGGRVGYAVGLDTPRSVAAISEALREAGYDVDAPPAEADLIRQLSRGVGDPFSLSNNTNAHSRDCPRTSCLGPCGLGRRGGRSGGARRRVSFLLRADGQADRCGAARSRAWRGA